MKRIALKIEYKGTNYHGFEKQKSHIPTVQQELENALGKIANHNIKITVAGRTDAGVHAEGQVIHFDTFAERDACAWVLGTNSILPDDISVLKAKEVKEDFNARFSATARIYQYYVVNRNSKVAINSDSVFWTTKKINLEKMQEAANYLIGEKDFTSFRAKSCQANTAFRNIHFIKITKHKTSNQDLIITTIKANAFLYHMVRNIMGSLLLVAEGKKKPIWINEVLQKKDRKFAGNTASAKGLRLVKVEYDKKDLTWD